MRILAIIALSATCAACVTTEVVQFKPAAGQRALVRDGQPGLVSERKSSIVIVRPAARELQAGGRPVFVVGIFNRSNVPQEFRVSNVTVAQTVNESVTELKVVTYEELVGEEKTRQAFRAIGAGLAMAGNSMQAASAGHYSSTSTVYTPRGGAYQVHTTGYSPTAAAIAQSNANAQNAQIMAANIEQGQANMVALEQTVIKDNTLMPQEWYGGQLHIAPLVQTDGAKNYLIAINVGADRHEVQIAQGSAR